MFERRFLVLSLSPLSLCAPAAPSSSAEDGIFRDLSPRLPRGLPARGGAWEVPCRGTSAPWRWTSYALVSVLAQAPAEGSAAAPLSLALPYPDGTDKLFRVEESPIMEPGWRTSFPEIRTYIAQGIDDPAATARLSLTPWASTPWCCRPRAPCSSIPTGAGMRATSSPISRRTRARRDGADFRCESRTRARRMNPRWKRRRVSLAVASGTQLRTYRLALAGTGEYSTAVCAPNPVAVPCALNAMAWCR